MWDRRKARLHFSLACGNHGEGDDEGGEEVQDCEEEGHCGGRVMVGCIAGVDLKHRVRGRGSLRHHPVCYFRQWGWGIAVGCRTFQEDQSRVCWW